MTAAPKLSRMDPADWPVRNMAVIVRRHLRNLSKVLRPYAMTPQMYRVLNYLAEVGEDNIGNVADQSAYERSYVSRVVDRLVADGYLERVPDPTDKRYTLVRLTEYGHRRWEEAMPAVAALMDHTIAGIPDPDLAAFVAAIRTVERNVNNTDPAKLKPPATVRRARGGGSR